MRNCRGGTKSRWRGCVGTKSFLIIRNLETRPSGWRGLLLQAGLVRSYSDYIMRRGTRRFALPPPPQEQCFVDLDCSCAVCGVQPRLVHLADWNRMQACGLCNVAQYCSQRCRKIAWSFLGHDKSCGNALPTPASIRAASATQLFSVLREYACAHAALATAVLSRLVELENAVQDHLEMIDPTTDPSAAALMFRDDEDIAHTVGSLSSRVFDPLLAVLNAHTEVPRVQAKACTLLPRLVCTEARLRAAIAAGAVPNVILAMRRANPPPPGMQYHVAPYTLRPLPYAGPHVHGFTSGFTRRCPPIHASRRAPFVLHPILPNAQPKAVPRKTVPETAAAAAAAGKGAEGSKRVPLQLRPARSDSTDALEVHAYRCLQTLHCAIVHSHGHLPLH